MNMELTLAHLLTALITPIVLVGLINRTKARWAGRKGPRILQSGSDLLRLLRKQAIYSSVATPLFRMGAHVTLVTSLTAMLFAPMFGSFAPLRFEHDFVVFAYTLGLGRIFLMLSAMDTGSAFEGMGAAREASFSAFAEPALFLLIGAAAIATGATSFATMLGGLHHSAHYPWIAMPTVIALFILLQTEGARVPVDDPQTHLELTMIHEVMILDHSGPELAAMQYAAGLKITLYAGMIAAVLNPFDPVTNLAACIATSIGIMAAVAIALGCVESLIARLPMKWVPRYVLVAAVAAAAALAVAGWEGALP